MDRGKHTAGPWTFDPDNRGRTVSWHYGISVEDGDSVAYVPEGNDADARLIAAAPDLLAVAVELLSVTDAALVVEGGKTRPLYNQLRAAIAKATGQDA